MERRIWGSDIYTSNSDAVCILQHSGLFQIKEFAPTNIEGVSLYFRVSKKKPTFSFNSSFKNGIKSQKSMNYLGHSIKPENYGLLKFLGNRQELTEMASRMPKVSEFERKKTIPVKLLDDLYQKENKVVFNLSNELWLSYSLPSICDKSKDYKDFTSWKLKNNVLYIETQEKRYEIARNIHDHKNDDYLFDEYETFRLSEVKSPAEKDNDYLITHSCPLVSEDEVENIFSRLDWHEFLWGESTLFIRNLEIKQIKCYNYYNIK